ncbi:MAG: hypothetical protein IKU34_02910 [Clostridia bacterium]|nr:hypothetical protein [Clostridia bacterium]
MPEIGKHLFLTGDKQVGKSTLLRRLIDARQLDCAGFETQAFYMNGERRGFTLHGRVEMPPYENDCICCVRIGEKKAAPVPEAFSQNGVDILQKSLESANAYILMDEIGRLESRSEAFCAQVLQTLDGEKRVLGVLQKCSSTLVEQISARNDVTVITVTPDNREELLQTLCEAY